MPDRVLSAIIYYTSGKPLPTMQRQVMNAFYTVPAIMTGFVVLKPEITPLGFRDDLVE
jgi:hypothetical protein